MLYICPHVYTKVQVLVGKSYRSILYLEVICLLFEEDVMSLYDKNSGVHFFCFMVKYYPLALREMPNIDGANWLVLNWFKP